MIPDAFSLLHLTSVSKFSRNAPRTLGNQSLIFPQWSTGIQSAAWVRESISSPFLFSFILSSIPPFSPSFVLRPGVGMGGVVGVGWGWGWGSLWTTLFDLLDFLLGYQSTICMIVSQVGLWSAPEKHHEETKAHKQTNISAIFDNHKIEVLAA